MAASLWPLNIYSRMTRRGVDEHVGNAFGYIGEQEKEMQLSGKARDLQ